MMSLELNIYSPKDYQEAKVIIRAYLQFEFGIHHQ